MSLLRPSTLVSRRATPRGRLVLAAVLVTAAGLRLSRPDGVWADLAGGALYAVLIVLLLALVRPATRTVTLSLVGLGLCTLVELAQLTGVPATLVESVPALRFVLGTTFWAPDLLAYTAGAALGGLLIHTLRDTRRSSPT